MLLLTQFFRTLWQKSISVQHASNRSILQREIAQIDSQLTQSQLAIIDNQVLSTQIVTEEFVPIINPIEIQDNSQVLANR